jgi:hypothetical protein
MAGFPSLGEIFSSLGEPCHTPATTASHSATPPQPATPKPIVDVNAPDTPPPLTPRPAADARCLPPMPAACRRKFGAQGRRCRPAAWPDTAARRNVLQGGDLGALPSPRAQREGDVVGLPLPWEQREGDVVALLSPRAQRDGDVVALPFPWEQREGDVVGLPLAQEQRERAVMGPLSA